MSGRFLSIVIGAAFVMAAQSASSTSPAPQLESDAPVNITGLLQPIALETTAPETLTPFSTDSNQQQVPSPSVPQTALHPMLHPANITNTDNLLSWVIEQDMPVQLESGEPIFLPLQRPHPAVAWGGEAVLLELPASRPALEEVLPAATLTLAEFAAAEFAPVESIDAASTGDETATNAPLTPIVLEETFTLQSGDTLATLLKRAGMSPASQYPLLQEMKHKLNPRRLQINMKFTVGYSDTGEVVALQFALADAMSYYLMKDKTLGWFGLQAIRPIETILVHASAVIDGTLYDAAQEAHLPVAALEEFVRIMGFTVDFQRQIRKGDSFALIYERSIDGLTNKELSADKLHYASMILSGEPLHFFRHDHIGGQVGWYDKTGASAVRTLMRTPVSGARVSSSFGMRRHPTKGYNAMHRGVDFAVPSGTPIVAAGTGRVELAGWNGSYGRYIRIKHTGTYKTAYAHLSRIASGIGAGTNVHQGQVIGFVGSSGRSTGAHLHYEILVNNHKVNPLTIKLPTGKGLEGEEFLRFEKKLAEITAYLDPALSTDFAEHTQ